MIQCKMQVCSLVGMVYRSPVIMLHLSSQRLSTKRTCTQVMLFHVGMTHRVCTSVDRCFTQVHNDSRDLTSWLAKILCSLVCSKFSAAYLDKTTKFCAKLRYFNKEDFYFTKVVYTYKTGSPICGLNFCFFLNIGQPGLFSLIFTLFQASFYEQLMHSFAEVEL